MTVLLLLALLIFLPAAVALLPETSLLPRAATRPGFSIGAPIVYRQQAVSTRPTADGHDIRPAERGEYYYYSIINYLRVAEVLGDGRIIAVARAIASACASGLTTPACAKLTWPSVSFTVCAFRIFDPGADRVGRGSTLPKCLVTDPTPTTGSLTA
jgi:hypothetical protein